MVVRDYTLINGAEYGSLGWRDSVFVVHSEQEMLPGLVGSIIFILENNYVLF